VAMGNGKRRKYNQCVCKFCARSGSSWRGWVKQHTHKLDRLWGKEEIRDQLNDM
jgi:hypothetical protein